jgi:transposase InsO family protein
MPWKEMDQMSLIKEFVELASQEGAKMAPLCRQFNISRRTGYKWLARYNAEGAAGLVPRSRKPKRSPKKTSQVQHDAVVAVRQTHPTWGCRKIRAHLEAEGYAVLPAKSTVTDILHREGLIVSRERNLHRAVGRFEHEQANDLLQMDFKGHFPTLLEGRCHPLTVLDDHSRFCICLVALADERRESVQNELTKAFRLYGVPRRMTMDNGSPWGSAGTSQRYTRLTAWLMRLGVRVSYSRPSHPQTQGKDERFHRTLNEDVIRGRGIRDLAQAQEVFDAWREIYNSIRPHEALGMKPPVSRYTPSSRPFPEKLAPVEYESGVEVRKVQKLGEMSYKGREWRIGRAFAGQPVALRPSETDGIVEVYFCAQRVAKLDLRKNQP